MEDSPPNFYPEVAANDAEDPKDLPADDNHDDDEEVDLYAEGPHGEGDALTGASASSQLGLPRRKRRHTYTRDALAVEILLDSLVIVPTRPAKEQLANHFLNMISMSVFGPGDRLPPERWLADNSTTNLLRATVAEAYDILEQMGVIESIAGKGSYVKSQESSRMYFATQFFCNAIGSAIKVHLSRPQIQRAFETALDMMFADRSRTKSQTRAEIRRNMQQADEQIHARRARDE